MDRLITTLFMPISADDKISIGASEELALIGFSKICRCQGRFKIQKSVERSVKPDAFYVVI